MTDFETELATLIGEEIITPVINTTYGIVQADIAMRKLKTLFADTILKIIPEKRKRNPGHSASEECYSEGYGNAAKDIEASIEKELGIKEK